jgi:hypothetical protein
VSTKTLENRTFLSGWLSAGPVSGCLQELHCSAGKRPDVHWSLLGRQDGDSR